jgi:hypothetical protein
MKRSIIEMQDVDSNKSVNLLLQTANVSTRGRRTSGPRCRACGAGALGGVEKTRMPSVSAAAGVARVRATTMTQSLSRKGVGRRCVMSFAFIREGRTALW